jgi:hypothetical protein
MNSLANQFKQILQTLTHCPECEALESQLADFAARVGAKGQTLVYCQSEKEWFLPVGAAVSFLSPYGIELKGNWHDGKRFIYAALKPFEPSPFTSYCVERWKDWQVAA